MSESRGIGGTKPSLLGSAHFASARLVVIGGFEVSKSGATDCTAWLTAFFGTSDGSAFLKSESVLPRALRQIAASTQLTTRNEQIRNIAEAGIRDAG
jgi:hypothetical protein